MCFVRLSTYPEDAPGQVDVLAYLIYFEKPRGMNKMDFLIKYKAVWIIILAASLVVALFSLLYTLIKRRSQRKKEREMLQIHRRNEALTDALSNPMNRGKEPRKASDPLEISWDDQAINEDTQPNGGRMFELIELSTYSKRKYVFRADEPVTIGSADDNQLVIFKKGVAERHCIIEAVNTKPVVRTFNGEKATLHRGKKAAAISGNGLFLNDGDQIELGNTIVQFRAFEG